MKPKEILELEEFYGIELNPVYNLNDINVYENRNTYFIDENNKLLGLNLNRNKISDINPIKKLTNLICLNLSINNISDLNPIKNFRNLKTLDLYNNKISDLYPIQNLLNLNYISLSSNEISDLYPIQNFNLLTILYIRNNKISDLNPIKDLINLQNLDLSVNQISFISPIQKLINLITLNLSSNNITDLSTIQNLINLKNLILSYNGIIDISSIRNIGNDTNDEFNCNLKFLDLSFNNITDLYPIKDLNNLIYLDLFDNEILDIKPIEELVNLNFLNLSYNPINEITPLKKLVNLVKLEIESCKIDNIQFIKHLKRIKNLNLSGNLISDIDPLKELINLENINLANNPIQDISVLFFILNLENLNFINFYNNPFLDKTDLRINFGGNHLKEIKSFLLRQQESNKLTIKLPAKVLFLGNHASGKSTFLDYFVQEEDQKQINENQKSTHILQIQQYKKEETNHNLPKAIIFDFGGQDYYHGIYKAFLTNNAINLLFFKLNNNYNKKVSDREDSTKQTFTFTRDYWIHQINNYNTFETISLIQTHADLDSRCNFQNNCSGIHIDHEFYISLNNVALKKNSNLLSLKYLEAVLNEKIEEHRKDIKEPQWYIEFLNYIMNFKEANAIEISEIKKHYKREMSDDYLFISDLKQLCEQGLILFYHDEPEIKDIAWLNPTATNRYIHDEILTKQILTENIKNFKKEEFEAKTNKDILALLKVQKVIFLDETDKDNPVYIIPGYLENAKDKDEVYFMISDFDDPSFVLKFEYFIPFGFMNQLICKYGANPDKKLYWKDQLLFTYENNARILIQLDFGQLEIKVFIKLNKNSITNELEISKMIFKDIINIYFDKVEESDEQEMLTSEVFNNADDYDNFDFLSEYNKKEYPKDLYLSIDGNYFVHFATLNDETLTKSEILGYSKDENGKLNKSNGKALSSIEFKNFTKNKNIQKMKKVFISYSKYDEDYKNEFVQHLVTLKEEGLIDPFNCDEIILGDISLEVIQNKLAECDYMVGLVSVHFLNTDYIRNFEVKKAIELGKRIIPIIIKPCDWEKSNIGDYHASLRGTNISLDKKLFLKGKIKKTKKDERAAYWVKIVQELRIKLLS